MIQSCKRSKRIFLLANTAGVFAPLVKMHTSYIIFIYIYYYHASAHCCTCRYKVKVLVPGAGLGRLVFDFARLGACFFTL